MSRRPDPKDGEGGGGEERLRGLESLRRKLRTRRQRRSAPRPRPPSGAGPEGTGPSILYQRDVPRTQVRPSAFRPPAGSPVPLVRAVSGEELRAPFGPPYYRVDQVLATLHPELAVHCRDEFLVQSRDTGSTTLVQELHDLCNGTTPSPRDIVFLDLETTGLVSSPLFLIGVLVAEREGFVIRQFLARTYAEERSIISAFAEEAGGKRLLVSFNGKSFDLPYLRARAAATGVTPPEFQAHLDLLHAARRVYSQVLPNCRLQTLERYICRRHRVKDIPGEHIPDAYHHFVRTGNAVEVARIIKHNAQDLVTLLELLVRMLGADGLQA